jgi:hypothetical protein
MATFITLQKFQEALNLKTSLVPKRISQKNVKYIAVVEM